jgi:hypothetical protein
MDSVRRKILYNYLGYGDAPAGMILEFLFRTSGIHSQLIQGGKMYTRLSSILLTVFLLLTSCTLPSSSTQTASPIPATAKVSAPAATISPQATLTSTAVPLNYPIVDSGQGKCYDDKAEIPCPASGPFFGQDAQYTGLEPSLTINEDGTITDQNTGLIWQRSLDFDGNGKVNAADKLTFAAASSYCENLTLAGSSDWRLPDIKTLDSLMDFRGTDPGEASGQAKLIPFLDNAYFDFAYGDTAAGELTTDSQFASSNLAGDGKTNGGMAFAANFADGSIKAYTLAKQSGVEKIFFVLCVRGNSAYGVNYFVDNGDDTVSDQATGLVWQKADNGKGQNWQEALAYCEDLSLAGKDDWRLPDAKSLMSLVDITRLASVPNSAAIDPLFSSTGIKNEAGESDFPFYWSSSTHVDWNGKGASAVYIAFGRAMGYLNKTWVDVHGAGSQRSDLKSGNPADFPNGRGLQGDAIRILNYARCVRGGNVTPTPGGNPISVQPALPVEIPVASPTVVPPGGGDGAPSPEAIAACSEKTVGQACQIITPLLVIDGTCKQLISDQVTQLIACMANVP